MSASLHVALGLSFHFFGTSQDIDTCLKSHLCPPNIICTTGTHSNNTPQYSQLIGSVRATCKGPAAPSALSGHLSLLASILLSTVCPASAEYLSVMRSVICLCHCRSLRYVTWTCLFSHQKCHYVCHTLCFVHSYIPACLASLSLLSHFHTVCSSVSGCHR